jgi:hypothetical protein
LGPEFVAHFASTKQLRPISPRFTFAGGNCLVDLVVVRLVCHEVGSENRFHPAAKAWALPFEPGNAAKTTVPKQNGRKIELAGFVVHTRSHEIFCPFGGFAAVVVIVPPIGVTGWRHAHTGRTSNGIEMLISNAPGIGLSRGSLDAVRRPAHGPIGKANSSAEIATVPRHRSRRASKQTNDQRGISKWRPPGRERVGRGIRAAWWRKLTASHRDGGDRVVVSAACAEISRSAEPWR